MTGEELPKAKVRRRRWFRVVWVVPLVAALVAGWLVYERMREYGPVITIKFADGAGLRIGQTAVKYRGVPVGEVTGIELSEDHAQVLVKARLRRSAATIARDGAVFWIVRPQVGIGQVSGLNTVFAGPEIQALPGKGEGKRVFTGLESAPVAFETPGLKIVLRAERPKSVKPNSPIYYRGVEVGVVQKLDLGPNAATADIQVLIWERYAPLVRSGSAFWNASGATVTGGILKGMNVEIESLRALLAGGIEFASPENSPRAKPGTVFFLHENPRREWLAWAPRIAVSPQAKGGDGKGG
jgi:paraquat-inducible protein B